MVCKSLKYNKMVTKFEDLDPTATYSFADYLTWQFQERVELIKGKLFKMAMPTERHQRVSGHLYRLFANYLHKKPCQVYHPPSDVRLENHRICVSRRIKAFLPSFNLTSRSFAICLKLTTKVAMVRLI